MPTLLHYYILILFQHFLSSSCPHLANSCDQTEKPRRERKRRLGDKEDESFFTRDGVDEAAIDEELGELDLWQLEAIACAAISLARHGRDEEELRVLLLALRFMLIEEYMREGLC